MDCRETRSLLNAFHDGELPAADRARVEEHLRGCPKCGALLADLARADRAAGVPDPGPAYWDRFNARVMDRVEREADGPGVKVLRPKGGWMREQLRYLLPAAAAALVLVIVYYGGIRPGVPTPAVPPAAGERAAPDSAGERTAKAEPGPLAAKKSGGATAARRLPSPVLTEERSATVPREERDRLPDRSSPAGNEEAPRERAPAVPAVAAPSPPPMMSSKRSPDRQEWPGAGGGKVAAGSVTAPAGSPPVTAPEGTPPGMHAERMKMAGAADRVADQQRPGKGSPASSPCDLARTLAEREQMRDAEAAQRACLAGDLNAPSREKGLVFLAELLDRQGRFSEADAVIAEIEKKYTQSRSLDLYLQQRPMVQKQPKAVPVTR